MTPHDLLRAHPILGALTDGEAQVLLRSARCRMVAAGEIVFLRDDAADGLYGVLSGSVQIVVDRWRARSLSLTSMEPGSSSARYRSWMAKAAARRLWPTSFRDWSISIATGCGLSSSNARRPAAHRPATVARMRRVTHLVEDSIFLDVSTRLARQIVALTDARAPTREHAGTATLHLSQNDLARMLGVSREFVGKQLDGMARLGIVELGRRRLTVRNAGALERLCVGERQAGRP